MKSTPHIVGCIFLCVEIIFTNLVGNEIDYKEAAGKFIELGNDFKKNLDSEMFPGQKKTVDGIKQYIDTVSDNVRRNVENLNKAKPEATGIKTPENDTEVNYTDYVNDETLNVDFSEILNNQDVNYDVDLAISNIINGRATEGDFEHFKPGNTANRQAFYETTGIKLPEDSRLSNYILNALNNKEKRIYDIYLKHNTNSLKQPDSLTVSDEDGIIETENVELHGFYEYKDKVKEATIEDYKAYKAVKATGVKGTIRVPPKHIDISVLEFNDEHAKNHGCNLEDAIRYIENAKCSISRKRWDGIHTNYYSFDGAAYVDNETNKIKTAFSNTEFDQITDGIMEVFK